MPAVGGCSPIAEHDQRGRRVNFLVDGRMRRLRQVRSVTEDFRAQVQIKVWIPALSAEPAVSRRVRAAHRS
jgi:hypothetical protein